jgi:transmembrane sensor
MTSGVAAIVVAASTWLYITPGRLPLDPASPLPHTAIIIAPERLTLPDGSIVELNGGAQISVDFKADAPGLRRVMLRRGEAHFQVAEDSMRPFVVEVDGGVQFRAVGTAFAVEVDRSSIEMLVTEGKVAVARASAGDASPLPVSAEVRVPETSLVLESGQGVVVDTTEPAVFAPKVHTASASEQAEKLAWRVPRLQFSETPLSEVATLLGQFSETRIKLASHHLGRLEISGALRADNIEPLLQMLEMNYQIRVSRLPGGEIELHDLR